MGVKGECIRHVSKEVTLADIEIDLWFESTRDYQKFDADLVSAAEVFGNDTMKLQVQTSLPPTPHPPCILHSDYTMNPDSPQQVAKPSSAPGLTVATGLKKALENQRVAATAESTYENMHIIPAALLQDRKLTCRWLFLAGSGEFHKWFDGPVKAPHIKVTIDREAPSTHVGETEFTLKVDTSRVDPEAMITKPASAVDFSDGAGYETKVRIQSVQAEKFRWALEWRATCFDEAWKKVVADEPVNTNDTKQKLF